MNINASNSKAGYGRWMFFLLLVTPVAFWYLASPVVAVNFSPNSKDEFRYVWNTQDRIHRGDIKHGGSSVEFSYIFPDEDFFMMFDWWADKTAPRCIYITPKRWSTLDIYLDEHGRLDTTKTDKEVIERLKPCPGQPDPFQP